MDQAKKVALITGASRGIGAAIAHELARDGLRVVINYKNSCQSANDLARAITAQWGVEALAIQTDVSRYDKTEEMIDTIHQKFGRIDVLVNNAGIVRDKLLHRMKEADWDEVINTNLKGVFNCSKAVLKIMRKQKRGNIISISSIVGQRGRIGQTNYAAAKAGVIAFSKSLAQELAPWHITVNVVVPGFTETAMTSQLPDRVRAGILEQIPMGCSCKPEHIAKMISYLTSDAAGYISGQVFNVDCRVV